MYIPISHLSPKNFDVQMQKAAVGLIWLQVPPFMHWIDKHGDDEGGGCCGGDMLTTDPVPTVRSMLLNEFIGDPIPTVLSIIGIWLLMGIWFPMPTWGAMLNVFWTFELFNDINLLKSKSISILETNLMVVYQNFQNWTLTIGHC